MIDLNPHLENKRACQLSRCWVLFFPSLRQTLTKLHDAVSALTRFLEFKPNHMFGCILDRQACTPTFATFRAILTRFKPIPFETARRSFPSEQFIRFKFDHKFVCQFDQQACLQTFETFRNIFTLFKPNLSKTTQRSFAFDKFLKIKI